MSTEQDLRCPGCNKLLARITSNGVAEIKRDGRLVAIVVSGALVCSRCGTVMGIRPPEIPLTRPG